MISYGLCVPFCLIAVYIVERRGLRFGLMIGAWLTAVGGGLCCLSTLPGLWSEDGSVTACWSTRTAFMLTVLGQALTGMGCPFISCVPTKVSQNWFGEGERTMATLILGMSNPLGLVLGQLVTPLIVTQPSHLPLLNLVWFLPAIPGFLLTVIGVKTSLPPTPPSPSAAASKTTSRRPFITTILQLARNVPFLIIFMFLGGAMGYISTLQTKLEQILCSRGYSDTIAGVSAALIIISGFVASFPIGYASMKSGKLILISKAACVPAVVVLGVSVWMFLQPFMEELMIVTCVFLGVFSLGIYPVMLELSVEATYPLDESVVTGLCYLSSAIQVLGPGRIFENHEFVLGVNSYVYRKSFQQSSANRRRERDSDLHCETQNYRGSKSPSVIKWIYETNFKGGVRNWNGGQKFYQLSHLYQCLYDCPHSHIFLFLQHGVEEIQGENLCSLFPK